MLRITIHEDGGVSRLGLAGRLEGPWVTETENVWHGALGPNRKIEIDLRQLTGIDSAGRDLLAAILRGGACFIFEDLWTRELLGELSLQQPCETGNVRSPAKSVAAGPGGRRRNRK